MVTLLVATDSTETSDALADYLAGTVEADDVIYAINSLIGGDDTSSEEVLEGEAAIDRIADQLDAQSVTVETHQFVRGNQPVEDVLSYADEIDADEIVLGIRKRTPVGKVVFGSTAQSVLLGSDRPVRCIPLVD